MSCRGVRISCALDYATRSIVCRNYIRYLIVIRYLMYLMGLSALALRDPRYGYVTYVPGWEGSNSTHAFELNCWPNHEHEFVAPLLQEVTDVCLHPLAMLPVYFIPCWSGAQWWAQHLPLHTEYWHPSLSPPALFLSWYCTRVGL